MVRKSELDAALEQIKSQEEKIVYFKGRESKIDENGLRNSMNNYDLEQSIKHLLKVLTVLGQELESKDRYLNDLQIENSNLRHNDSKEDYMAIMPEVPAGNILKKVLAEDNSVSVTRKTKQKKQSTKLKGKKTKRRKIN